MTLQVSNIAGDGERWRRHINPKTHRGVRPAWLAKEDKVGRTAYGIRGYIRSMKRTKCRIQVDRGTQGRNTRAVNYTHTLDRDRCQEGQGRQNLRREPPGIPNHTQPSDTDVRNAMGDRVFVGNLQGF